MPLDRYSLEDPFENHPLFKSEEQARLEETLDGVEAPTVRAQAPVARVRRRAPEGPALDEGLWGARATSTGASSCRPAAERPARARPRRASSLVSRA